MLPTNREISSDKGGRQLTSEPVWTIQKAQHVLGEERMYSRIQSGMPPNLNRLLSDDQYL